MKTYILKLYNIFFTIIIYLYLYISINNGIKFFCLFNETFFNHSFFETHMILINYPLVISIKSFINYQGSDYNQSSFCKPINHKVSLTRDPGKRQIENLQQEIKYPRKHYRVHGNSSIIDGLNKLRGVGLHLQYINVQLYAGKQAHDGQGPQPTLA